MRDSPSIPFFFFFNDTATTEIYTLSLHDALPIFSEFRALDRRYSNRSARIHGAAGRATRHQAYREYRQWRHRPGDDPLAIHSRSEEHTSELQSPDHLVCRLLLEKKKK